jgi:hypothetical protein
MAYLSKLGDNQFRLPDCQVCTYPEAGQVESFGSDIFSKIAGHHVQPLGSHGLDAFLSQKTNLPMPFTGMSIIFQTKIGDEPGRCNVFFSYAFTVTNGDCSYLKHFIAS